MMTVAIEEIDFLATNLKISVYESIGIELGEPDYTDLYYRVTSSDGKDVGAGNDGATAASTVHLRLDAVDEFKSPEREIRFSRLLSVLAIEKDASIASLLMIAINCQQHSLIKIINLQAFNGSLGRDSR